MRRGLAICLCCAMAFMLGCSQLKETGRALRDDNGVFMESEERYLGGRKYLITLRGSSLLYDGQVEQAMKRRADDYTRSLGCRGWTMAEYKAGTENTLLGARRYIEAVVECLPNLGMPK
jgi:hypothetical protein